MGTLHTVKKSLLEDNTGCAPREAFPRSAAARLAILCPLALLFACGECEGWIEVADGSIPLETGASIQLEFYFDEEPVSTAARCGGYWYVDQIEGGNEEVGTVTPCGLYTAPLVPPAEPPVVMAAIYEIDGCADCCPYATIEIPIVAPANASLR